MSVTADLDRPGAPGIGESPAGVRLARRRWRDPRLLVGVLLILVSAVGVVWVVNAADERVTVWAVARDLPAGSPITMDRLTAVPVQVPELSAYWPADQQLPADVVAARDFAAGELLSRTGVAVVDAAQIRNVTIPVPRNQMPYDLEVGQRVDVYVVERTPSGEPIGAPELVQRNAIVASVDDGGGAFGGSSLESGVALSLPQDQVPDLLDAEARGTLTLVDVPVVTP